MVFRPLAGCGLFRPRSATGSMPSRFPSPCGVWVVSMAQFFANCKTLKFPSPCGVWVVSTITNEKRGIIMFPSPCGVWVVSRVCYADHKNTKSFRPLAGCGLFLGQRGQGLRLIVSVPLRGVGCFCDKRCEACQYPEFPSPCGVWVVSSWCFYPAGSRAFPSPCGVWVVSITPIIPSYNP